MPCKLGCLHEVLKELCTWAGVCTRQSHANEMQSNGNASDDSSSSGDHAANYHQVFVYCNTRFLTVRLGYTGLMNDQSQTSICAHTVQAYFQPGTFEFGMD